MHAPDTDQEGFEIDISPKVGVLERHGIAIPEFEDAVHRAITAYERRLNACTDDDEVPRIDDIMLDIHGLHFRITDVATISYPTAG